MYDASLDLRRRQLPLYLGLYVLSASALYALTASVNASAYAWLTHAALAGGCLLSYRGAVHKRLYLVPGVLALVLGFTAYGLRQVALPALDLLYPPEIVSQNDLALAALVAWFMIGFSYWQASRPNLVFMVACSLALFGLVGTINLNAQTWLCFSIFVFATVFCWGYEQFLDQDDRLAQAGHERYAAWPEMLRAHLALATLLALLALGAGRLLGSGAYAVTPNVYARMAERAYGWDITRLNRVQFSSFEDEFRIGTGPVHLSSEVVFRVAASHQALWRGAIYDYYDGRGWSRQERTGRQLAAVDGAWQVPAAFLPERSTLHPLRQHFRLNYGSAQIPAAAQPESLAVLQAPAPSGRPLRWYPAARPMVDRYGCLLWEGGVTGMEYEVVSQEPDRAPAVLRAAPPADLEARGLTSCLQVPAPTKLALGSLVDRLTANAPTPYDKAMALMGYLQDHCLYSLNSPPVPYGQDVVVQFVLRSRRGACDQFASALTMLCRLAHVPARLATGYAPGEFEAKTGEYVVRGTDAHAWTEIYFPGVGWVAFDPQTESEAEATSWTELLSGRHWDLAARQALRTLAGGLVIALLLLVAVSALADPLAAWRSWRQRPTSELGLLARDYDRALRRALRRAGLKPDPGATPQERAALLTATNEKTDWSTLTERFYALRYGPHPSRRALRLLRAQLRRRR